MAGISSPWANRRDVFLGQVQPAAHGVSNATLDNILAAIDKVNASVTKMNAVRPSEACNIAGQTLTACRNNLSHVIQSNNSPKTPVRADNQQTEVASEETVRTPSLR